MFSKNKVDGKEEQCQFEFANSKQKKKHDPNFQIGNPSTLTSTQNFFFQLNVIYKHSKIQPQVTHNL